jgi:hypothetical protein
MNTNLFEKYSDPSIIPDVVVPKVNVKAQLAAREIYHVDFILVDPKGVSIGESTTIKVTPTLEKAEHKRVVNAFKTIVQSVSKGALVAELPFSASTKQEQKQPVAAVMGDELKTQSDAALKVVLVPNSGVSEVPGGLL